MTRTKVVRPPGFAQATFAIGTLSRFAKFCQQNDPTVIARAIMEHEVADVRRDIAVVDRWLDLFVNEEPQQ